jgi:hypothetical protein
MDLAFGPGRKLRMALASPTVNQDILTKPFTTTILAARRTEGEPLNNAEQCTFLFKFAAAPTGDIQVERSDEPYFQQYGLMQTITVTDDVHAYDITVRTVGIIRFFNNTDQSVEITCVKQMPRFC